MESQGVLKVFKEENLFHPKYEFIFTDAEFPQNLDRMSIYDQKDSSEAQVEEILRITKEKLERGNSDNLDNSDNLGNSIKGIYLKYDFETLILCGVLSEIRNSNFSNFSKFRVPSFESIFLCNHKYYQRKHERNPIKFSYFDIFEENWRDSSKFIPFPFYMKCANQQRSLHHYIVRNSQQLEKTVNFLRRSLPSSESYYKYINTKYIDVEKYPLSNKYVMLCEELVEDNKQINWEGWADSEGNIHTFGFADEVLADPGIFSDFIIPSNFSKKVKDKVSRICSEFLKDIDFRNGFANIELWVSPQEDVRIIEVNPRIAFSYAQQYQDVYGADLIGSAIRLSMGLNVDSVPDLESPKLFSSQSVFATRLNGKICDLLDLKKLREEEILHPDYFFEYLFTDPEFEIVDNFQNGARVLLRIFFNKSSYEEVQMESLRLKRELLVKDTYYMHYLEKDVRLNS